LKPDETYRFQYVKARDIEVVVIDGKCPNCNNEVSITTRVGKKPTLHSKTAIFYCKKCGYVLGRMRDDSRLAKESETVGVQWEG